MEKDKTSEKDGADIRKRRIVFLSRVGGERDRGDDLGVGYVHSNGPGRLDMVVLAPGCQMNTFDKQRMEGRPVVELPKQLEFARMDTIYAFLREIPEGQEVLKKALGLTTLEPAPPPPPAGSDAQPA